MRRDKKEERKEKIEQAKRVTEKRCDKWSDGRDRIAYEIPELQDVARSFGIVRGSTAALGVRCRAGYLVNVMPIVIDRR